MTCRSLLIFPIAIALVGQQHTTSGRYLQKDTLVLHTQSANHIRIYSKPGSAGKYVTILPSLGRGVEDYTEAYQCTLTARLVEAGYRVVLIQPRGIGKSKGDLTPQNVTMKVLVDDLRATLDALGIGKIHMVGHAFGNRLARTFAAYHPERVDALALLASGGSFPIPPDALEALRGSYDLSLADDDRLEMLQRAFFARGNDQRIWLKGWYPELAAAQSNAARTVDPEVYKRAGNKPFLLVQALEDTIAPPDLAGRALKKELGDQVTYVEIARAGHALTSEQPDEIARHLIAYFGRAVK